MTTNTGSRFEDRLLVAILELHPELTREPSASPARRLATPRTHPRLPRQPGRRFALAVVAVVAAGAVGLGAVLLSAGGSGQTSPARGAVLNARTVAYRATEALNQATGNSIEYVREVKTNGAGDVISTTEIWFYDGSHRVEFFGHNGSPDIDESVATAAGLRTGLVVDYSRHTWFRTSQRAITLPQDGDVATVIRGELRSHQLTPVWPGPALDRPRNVSPGPAGSGAARTHFDAMEPVAAADRREPGPAQRAGAARIHPAGRAARAGRRLTGV
jgi:hypothetical protein